LKTSLYNHKSIGSDDKPLIPNIIFKGLVFLITHNSEKDAKYIIKNYTLTEYQNNLISKLNNYELDNSL
jgi:hypothetical protein